MTLLTRDSTPPRRSFFYGANRHTKSTHGEEVSGGARRSTIVVVGTVGIPAAYGGFETLVENLARYRSANDVPCELVVYCSSKAYTDRLSTYLGAELRYVGLRANGASSVVYDTVCLFSALRHRVDFFLLLGVSGAIALPIIRLLSRGRIVTNVDGIEWKRGKWKGLSKWFLRLSEKMAVKFSHEVIADNGGIARHVLETYGRRSRVVAYGGDHAVRAPARAYEARQLPQRYALSVCRIEPENNVAMVLAAFASQADMPLVFVGNWANSAFGIDLRQRFASMDHLYLLDPIYDVGVLRTLRSSAAVYVHGHSAGGTNPSLVEMMHFGIPVLAYDCIFNRFTTEENAIFFETAAQLRSAVVGLNPTQARGVGLAMQRIAQQRYTWAAVGREYFRLLGLDESRPTVPTSADGLNEERGVPRAGEQHLG